MKPDEQHQDEGVRERKRRETRARIAETGLKLFLQHGYDATTLDAMADAAGISRRTFFAYFSSKEDVLLSLNDSGFRKALRPTLLEQPRDQSPIDAAQACFLKLVSQYENKSSIQMDKLLRSTESLRARKEASFITMESDLLEGMCAMWPDPARRAELAMASAVSMSALRLALEEWRRDNAKRSLALHIEQSFATLCSLFGVDRTDQRKKSSRAGQRVSNTK